MATVEREARIDTTLAQKQPTLQVMLESVHDSQNLSTILRTCDAVGVLDLYYSSAQHQTLKIHKTITQGAHRWVRRNRVEESQKRAFIQAKKAEGFQVVATHLSAKSVGYRSLDYTKPTLFIVGNEKEGVSLELLEEATDVVVIPMQGMVQSLNVSVATALILYEAQRQRQEAQMYEMPQLSQEAMMELKRVWIHRDSIARKSKGKVALEFYENLLSF